MQGYPWRRTTGEKCWQAGSHDVPLCVCVCYPLCGCLFPRTSIGCALDAEKALALGEVVLHSFVCVEAVGHVSRACSALFGTLSAGHAIYIVE